MFRKLLWLAVIACSAQAQDPLFPLESVSVEGTLLSKEFVLDITGLRTGTRVNKAAIEAGCAKLRESGMFASIGYSYAPGPKRGYALKLTLSDQSSLSDASMDFPGIDENELWQWLVSRYPSFDRKAPGSAAAQEFIAKRLEEHLGPKLDGQRVVARLESDLMRQTTLISFQPETLPRIASMAFTGLSELTSVELAGLLQKAMANDGYTDRRFREAVEMNVRRAYEGRGMYRVRFPRITIQKAGPLAVAVTTAIEEGPKFTLGEVQLTGDNLRADAIMKAAKFRRGEVANWMEIEKEIWEIERAVKRTGYLDAVARPERVLDDSRRVLDVKVPRSRSSWGNCTASAGCASTVSRPVLKPKSGAYGSFSREIRSTMRTRGNFFRRSFSPWMRGSSGSSMRRCRRARASA